VSGELVSPHKEIFGVSIAPEKSPWKYGLFLSLAYFYHNFLGRKLEWYGTLPEEGPGIVVPKHRGRYDTAIMHLIATLEANRDLVMVGKHTALDHRIPEDQEEVKANGKKPTNPVARRIEAALSSLGSPIPVNRKRLGPETMHRMDQVVKRDDLLCVFIQHTRMADDLLTDPQPLAAIEAYRHPDVPMYPTWLDGTEILNPFSDQPMVVSIDPDPQSMRQLGLYSSKNKSE
jgi:hypothetical protein